MRKLFIAVAMALCASVAQGQTLPPLPEPQIHASDSLIEFHVVAKSLGETMKTLQITETKGQHHLYVEKSGKGPPMTLTLSDTLAPTTLIAGYSVKDLQGAVPGTYTDTIKVYAFGARPAYIVVKVKVEPPARLVVRKPGSRDTVSIERLDVFVFEGEQPRDTVFEVINPDITGGGGLFGLHARAIFDKDSLPPPFVAARTDDGYSPTLLKIRFNDATLKPGQDSAARIVVAADTLLRVKGNPTEIMFTVKVRKARGTIGGDKTLISFLGSGRLSDSVLISNAGAGGASRLSGLAAVDSTRREWLSVTLDQKTTPTFLRLYFNGDLLKKPSDTALVYVSDPQSLNYLVVRVVATGAGTSAIAVNTDTARIGENTTVRRAVTATGRVGGLRTRVSFISGESGWLTASIGANTPTELVLEGRASATRSLAIVEISSSDAGVRSVFIPVVSDLNATTGPVTGGSRSAGALVGETPPGGRLGVSERVSSIVVEEQDPGMSVALERGGVIFRWIGPGEGVRKARVRLVDGSGETIEVVILALAIAREPTPLALITSLKEVKTLTEAQAIWLDSTGNKNGRVDTGDVARALLHQ